MSDARSEVANDRVDVRLNRYKKWDSQCAYAAAGLGGLAVIGGLADPFDGRPQWLAGVFITSLLLAGGLLGRAHLGYFNAANILEEVRLRSGAADSTLVEQIPEESLGDLQASDIKYPWGARNCYDGMSFLALVACCVLIAAAWWRGG